MAAETKGHFKLVKWNVSPPFWPGGEVSVLTVRDIRASIRVKLWGKATFIITMESLLDVQNEETRPAQWQKDEN